MRFLIIRFSSIGDIVLTTPVIRCLKQQLPGAEIHYLTGAAFKPVLQNNPYIDHLHLFSGSLKQLLPEIKSLGFDAIIDLHHNIRTWSIKLRTGIKSHSFRKLNVEKWIMVNTKINLLPPVHIVDRYMETVASYGVKYDGRGLDYFLTPEEESLAGVVPEDQRKYYTAFVIGAKHATKRLPDSRITELCKKIQHPVVLLGGPEDKTRGEQIAQLAGSHVLNLCGRLPLNGSAAVLKKSSRVITHDTGLMHIAAAFNKPIISVWGKTIPAFGMTPLYDNSYGGFGAGLSTVREVQKLSCRPCTKLGFEKCPRKHFRCMKDIPLESIAGSNKP
ncbi:MAG: glycosyltransferase family 9 protein [Bacteroidia bacterium]|nr:glycosyltransferase family 9 protein [Bacteroidia bacterium]